MNITGALRAHPRRDLQHLRVHAQAAGARLLAGSEPARRRVPVQPVHRPGRDRRQPRRVAAGRGPGAGDRAHPQPGARHDPDRHRRVHPDADRQPQPVRRDRAVPARQVPRRPVPVRRLPRLDRGLPRDPDPVHQRSVRRRRVRNRCGRTASPARTRASASSNDQPRAPASAEPVLPGRAGDGPPGGPTMARVSASRIHAPK